MIVVLNKNNELIDFYRENDAVVDVYGEAIVYCDELSRITAHEDVTIHAYGGCMVTSYDRATVYASDSTTIQGYNCSLIYAEDDAFVEASDETHVTARNNAEVKAHDNANIIVYDFARADIYDCCAVHANGGAVVSAHDNAIVIAEDWSEVTAYNYVVCHAHDYADINLKDKASVFDFNPTNEQDDLRTCIGINEQWRGIFVEMMTDNAPRYFIAKREMIATNRELTDEDFDDMNNNTSFYWLFSDLKECEELFNKLKPSAKRHGKNAYIHTVYDMGNVVDNFKPFDDFDFEKDVLMTKGVGYND